MNKTLLLLLFTLANICVMAQDTVSVHIINPSEAYPIYSDGNSSFILRAKATNTDTTESIVDAQFKVDGILLNTFMYGDYYVAEWTPTFGVHNFYFKATSSSGENAEESFDATAIFGTQDTTVNAFDSVLVKFGGTGRTINVTANLPNHVAVYDSLHAIMNVTCPSGDCDPWDRVAWIDVKSPDGTWVELIRYITPYGKSCSHDIDLSDYLFLLNGEVEFRVFVDTWTGSWEFDLDLEYYTGFTDKIYGKVVPIYDGAYQFGDYADLTPFDSIEVSFDENIEHVQFNMLLSGHGWDPAINTDNAAEFYPAVHQVFFNDDTVDQDTWKNCDPNPDNCSPQAGTWYNDRSGWCPGAITHPYIYDLDSFLLNEELIIYYEFDQNYIDFCHPNHPDCVSNVTCNNCEEGFNPHYYIGANLFLYQNDEPFELKNRLTSIVEKNKENFTFSLSPNPSKNVVEIISNANAIFFFYSVDGKLLHKVDTKKLTENGNKVSLEKFNRGVYFVEMLKGKQSKIQKLIIE